MNVLKNIDLFKTACMVLLVCLSLTATRAQVTIGSTYEPAPGALLDLKSNLPAGVGNNTTADKGLLFPRVKLLDKDNLNQVIANGTDGDEKRYYRGLMVYNTGTTNNFIEGLYLWDGDRWVRPMTDTVITTPQSNVLDRLNLVTNTPTQLGVTVSGLGDNGSGGGGGAELKFAKETSPNSPLTPVDIVIPESGSYAFCFRLYGKFDTGSDFPTSGNKSCVYYMSLWADEISLSSSNKPKDIAEIDLLVPGLPVGGDSREKFVATYSITLGGRFNKGDKVRFKLAHHPTANIKLMWNLVSNKRADATTLLWWKL